MGLKIGLGFDLHKIKRVSKGSIMIGGIAIQTPYKIQSVSDGDIIFHALADAILSALGLPDIGSYFPPHDPKSKGLNSKIILHCALLKMRRKKATINNVSIVVAVQEPKLSPWAYPLRNSLSKSLGVPQDSIGLSFKTFENIKPFSNQAIACWATCLLAQ